jgi:17beta-estradiol 17-dehydrogenase / very-long-chain 3-oxoacyl-CoA reductase
LENGLVIKVVQKYSIINMYTFCVKFIVVTGSSNGIGLNYAKQLASRGMNLVLISNEDEKLHQVSKEIGEKMFPNLQSQYDLIYSTFVEECFGVETRVIVADFSLNEDEYIRIFESLDDLDIGVLGMDNNFFLS